MSKIRLDYTNYEKSTPQLVATLRHFWEIKKDDLFIFDFLSVSDYKHIRKTSFPVIGYRENGGVSDILYNNRGAYTDSRKVLVLLTVDDMMEIIHKVMGMLPFPDENLFEVSVKTNSRGTSVSTLTEKIRGLYPTIVSFEGITRVDSMFDLLSYVLKMYPEAV